MFNKRTTKLLFALGGQLEIVLVLIMFLLFSSSPAPTAPSPTPTPTPEPTPTPAALLPSAGTDRGQLTSTPRGQADPNITPSDPENPGTLVTQTITTDTTSITSLGPGAIIFGDYAFTTYQGQLIKIPLSCTDSCNGQLTLNLQTYTNPGVNTPRAVSFPLFSGRVAGPSQIMLYENENHDRIIADVVFSLLQNRRANQNITRDSYNFGTLTPVGLYLFIENAPKQVNGSDDLQDTTSVYLMTVPNSIPALLYADFSPSVSYAGQLYDGEPMELFYERTLLADQGIYTHNLYIYFPKQNIIQPIFENLSLLGISNRGELVVYYPRTQISSPQIGLITINPQLHGIKGNQVIVAPEDMPSEEIPDYADGHFYFVTADMKIYHSTLENPYPTLTYDFSANFRAKGYQLTNWWYTHANNNHVGVCICSQEQVQQNNTGAFYDFQLGQFIEQTPECIGRHEVGTWYCS